MNHKVSRRSFLLSSAAALLSLAACRDRFLAPEASLPNPGSTETRPTNEETEYNRVIGSGGRPQDAYRAPPLALDQVDPSDRIDRSEEEWRALLSPEQYQVIRLKGSEREYTGLYTDYDAAGTYHCVACGNPLFSSETKYDSKTGWPSFWAPIQEGRLRTELDTSLGSEQTRVLCARCGAHLGDVFKDGPPPTGLRYCLNSIALNFAPSVTSGL